MKRSILYALLALFICSCAREAQDSITDNRDDFLTRLAQSDEYHNYFTAMIETGKAMQNDPLDQTAAETLLEKGLDFRTLPVAEIQHIAGAVTYVQSHQRMDINIEALNAQYPAFPNEMSSAERIEMRQRYFAYRNINPMDLNFTNQQ